MQATNKKKSILRFLWYLILSLNIIAILILFLSALAWKVSPVKTTIFAYLGLGYIIILIVNIIFLLFWLIMTKWKYALVSFVSLLICINPTLTYFPLHTKTKTVPDDCIKVLSYNVRGFNWHKYKKADENETLLYIQKSGADIVCIQEYLALDYNKNTGTKKIKEILKDYPYYSYVKLNSIYNSGNSHYGIACFSKYPILSTEQIPIDTRENAGAVMYKIKIKDKIISVFNNHLESNRLTSEDRKLYIKLVKDRDRQVLDDAAQNLRRRLGAAYVKRAPQADLVNNWINEQKTDGVIVCGDFNDTPISYTYKTVKGELKDSFAETGFGAGITYHENYFWFRIDFIMHSKNMKAYNCTVDKVTYSDHYPLWTYLKFE